jgi:hypothetical protein
MGCPPDLRTGERGLVLEVERQVTFSTCPLDRVSGTDVEADGIADRPAAVENHRDDEVVHVSFVLGFHDGVGPQSRYRFQSTRPISATYRSSLRNARRSG